MFYGPTLFSKSGQRASLVVQWLGVSLAMQGTPVRSLVQEDPTEQPSPCATVTEPMCCNYGSPRVLVHVPQQEKPLQ